MLGALFSFVLCRVLHIAWLARRFSAVGILTHRHCHRQHQRSAPERQQGFVFDGAESASGDSQALVSTDISNEPNNTVHTSRVFFAARPPNKQRYTALQRWVDH